MRVAKQLPEEFLGVPFTVGAALNAGLTRRRLRARDLASPCRGVRQPAVVEGSLLAQVRALSAATGAIASHTTAAALWGFPLPLYLQDHLAIHLTHQRGSRAVRRQGVVGHQAQLRPEEITCGRFLSCTSALRTWFDLALILGEEDLVIAGDHLLRRRQPLATASELDAYLETRRGAPGYRNAARARNRMRSGTDSPKETEVRLLLAGYGLPEPQINVPMFDGTGAWVQDPDMSYEEYKVAIQYDGGHHATPAQRRSDISRDEDALELGWRVVRLTQLDLDVRDAHGVPRAVTRVRRALLERGWAPGPSRDQRARRPVLEQGANQLPLAAVLAAGFRQETANGGRR